MDLVLNVCGGLLRCVSVSRVLISVQPLREWAITISPWILGRPVSVVFHRTLFPSLEILAPSSYSQREGMEKFGSPSIFLLFLVFRQFLDARVFFSVQFQNSRFDNQYHFYSRYHSLIKKMISFFPYLSHTSRYSFAGNYICRLK